MSGRVLYVVSCNDKIVHSSITSITYKVILSHGYDGIVDPVFIILNICSKREQ